MHLLCRWSFDQIIHLQWATIDSTICLFDILYGRLGAGYCLSKLTMVLKLTATVTVPAASRIGFWGQEVLTTSALKLPGVKIAHITRFAATILIFAWFFQIVIQGHEMVFFLILCGRQEVLKLRSSTFIISFLIGQFLINELRAVGKITSRLRSFIFNLFMLIIQAKLLLKDVL